jgi:hypothetical protein
VQLLFVSSCTVGESALNTSTALASSSLEHLRNQIGLRWADLVDNITRLPVSDPHVMAFSLTLRRIQRSVQSGPRTSLRDPQCKVCANEITSEFKGSEQELIELYYLHLAEISATIKTMRQVRQKQTAHSAA